MPTLVRTTNTAVMIFINTTSHKLQITPGHNREAANIAGEKTEPRNKNTEPSTNIRVVDTL